MSNVKEVRIIADVPFDFLMRDEEDGGLPAAEKAAVASALLSPSTGLTYSYASAGLRPNDHGGRTTMYRLTIEGHDAMSWGFLGRVAMALNTSGSLAELHVAEARDLDAHDGALWVYLVPDDELSGAAIQARR